SCRRGDEAGGGPCGGGRRSARRRGGDRQHPMTAVQRVVVVDGAAGAVVEGVAAGGAVVVVVSTAGGWVAGGRGWSPVGPPMAASWRSREKASASPPFMSYHPGWKWAPEKLSFIFLSTLTLTPPSSSTIFWKPSKPVRT